MGAAEERAEGDGAAASGRAPRGPTRSASCGLGQRALGVRPQQPAGLGQLEPAAGADEQRDAELGLEPADLLGQARLGHQQRVRGRRERPVVGRGEEIGELLQASRLFLSTLESIKPKTMSHKRPILGA